jgi:hypothetical protein
VLAEVLLLMVAEMVQLVVLTQQLEAEVADVQQ